METELALCARGVAYSYRTRQGKVAAVESLSCELAGGRVTAIVGPSGSGKSTLGLLLAGLLKPDSGTVFFSDQERASPEEVAYLFQFPEQLFSEETVERELCQAKTVTPESAGHALRSVGLDPQLFLRCSPFELSGGQARLVATAVQLARPSRAVIFDEPTAGLDWNMRARIRELIGAQAKAGKIVGLVTHSLSFAASVSDFAVALNAGHIVWEGDPRYLANDTELRSTLGL